MPDVSVEDVQTKLHDESPYDDQSYGANYQPTAGQQTIRVVSVKDTSAGRVGKIARRVGPIARRVVVGIGQSSVVSRTNKLFGNVLVNFLQFAGLITFAELNVVLYRLEGFSYLMDVVRQTWYVPFVLVLAWFVLYSVSHKINERYNGSISHIIGGVAFVLMAGVVGVSLQYLTEVEFMSVIWLSMLAMIFVGPYAAKHKKEAILKASAKADAEVNVQRQAILDEAEQLRDEASADRQKAAIELGRAQEHARTTGEVFDQARTHEAFVQDAAANLDARIKEVGEAELARTKAVHETEYAAKRQRLEMEHEGRVAADVERTSAELIRQLDAAQNTIQMLRTGQSTMPSTDSYDDSPQEPSRPFSGPTVPTHQPGMPSEAVSGNVVNQ
jgi:hypothetical protein